MYLNGFLGLVIIALFNEAYKAHKKSVETGMRLYDKGLEVKEAKSIGAGYKKRAEDAEIILSRTKTKLKESEELNLHLNAKNGKLLNEKKEVFKEISGLRKENNAILEENKKIIKEKTEIEKKLKLSQEEITKLKGEVGAISNEMKIVENNVDRILNGSREVRRDFIKNGMQNIEFYR